MSEARKTLPIEMQIAVIGVSGRFPGAQNIQEFWQSLCDGVESITFFSKDALTPWGIQPGLINDPNFVPAKGAIQDPEYFDAHFFGYSRREAESMDPQMRLFHECVWEALEDAGYNPEGNNGTVGVFAGASANIYWQGLTLLNNSSNAGTQFAALSLADKDFMNAQISYKLNLKGPSLSVDSACSTSLVAIHLACRALLTGECNLAIAGGISVPVPSPQGYLYQEGMILSPDGHCRPFDAQANGTVPGEGAGIVVLKPLKRALTDGDHIYAVIRGSAINNDGNRKIGFTAPSIEGQSEVIRAAHRMSVVEPESISYIEAHGTATSLGDPIEIAALKAAFRTEQRHFCHIGSVKSNLGHLDAAAGVAGLIKTVLALHHRQIPPSLHFSQPNPKLDLTNSPFIVATQLTPWSNPSFPLRAGVSSFGIGGTNAHVILEEAPALPVPSPCRATHLLLLSAKTPTALQQMSERLRHFLQSNPDVSLADLAYTLQVGRAHFAHRRLVLCSSLPEAIELLTALVMSPIVSIAAQEQPHAEYEQLIQDLLQHEQEAHAAMSDVSKVSHLLQQLGQLWLAGATIDWAMLYPQQKRRRLSLPTYPFERQRFWLNDALEKRIVSEGGLLSTLAVAPNRSQPQSYFYAPTWERQAYKPTPVQRQVAIARICLIFCDQHGIASALAERLQNDGKTIITVAIGAEYTAWDERHFSLHPAINQHYQSLISDLHSKYGSIETIIYCWGIAHVAPQAENLAHITNELQQSGYQSLLSLARAIAHYPDSPTHITIITNQMVEVIGTETLCPAQALLLGPAQVIPQEYQQITCSIVDVMLTTDRLDRWTTDLLIEEIAANASKSMVALRGKYRWTQVFQPFQPEQNTPLPLRSQGTYLITGGLGAVGLTLAEAFATTVQANLILITSSDFPARAVWNDWLYTKPEQDPTAQKIRRLLAIERQGATVIVASVDITNRAEMQELIEKTLQRFQALHGVIHCAGRADGALIHGRTKAWEQQVLSAKVLGTLVLDDVLSGLALDFVVLYSALSAIVAPIGQVGYVAANSFLDAFAHYKNAQSANRWISIGGDTWREAGMAVEAKNTLQANVSLAASRHLLSQQSHNGFSNEEGAKIFFQILATSIASNTFSTSPSHIIVATEELSKKIEQNRAMASFYNHEVPTISSNHVDHPVESIGEMERLISELWKKFLDLDTLDVHDNWFDLGASSLDIIQLTSLINTKLGTDISAPQMFTFPTVRLLTEFIYQKNSQSTQESRPQDREEQVAEGKARLKHRLGKAKRL